MTRTGAETTRPTPTTRARETALLDLERWLEGAHVTARVMRHPTAATARDLAEALGRPAEMIAKTVVVDRDGELLSVVLPASEQIDSGKLREVLGGRRLALAHEDDVLRVAPAYELGALPPIGPGVPRTAVVDRRLLTYSHVLCAAGDRTVSLMLDPADVVRIGSAAVADVSRER
jgi:prolyl-tRNA editing enzyme YbaK/EbsC (Cys-tRNA(Pro) deacylase)